MLKGVCMFECVCVCCCVNGGYALCATDLGGESLFYGHFMLREGLFMAAGYCFLKVWLLLLERSIKRAESGGDYTSLCCASIWGDHLSRVHSQRRDSLNHVLLGRRVLVTWETDYTNINTCMHSCTKTLTCRNTDAQCKTCMLMCTHELSDRTPGDPSDLHPHSTCTADFTKTLMSTPD